MSHSSIRGVKTPGGGKCGSARLGVGGGHGEEDDALTSVATGKAGGRGRKRKGLARQGPYGMGARSPREARMEERGWEAGVGRPTADDALTGVASGYRFVSRVRKFQNGPAAGGGRCGPECRLHGGLAALDLLAVR